MWISLLAVEVMIKILVENPSHPSAWCHKTQEIGKQKKKFWFEFKSIVTNVLLLLTIIDIYGLDKSDYQMDSQNIKYAIIIFVCLDVKLLEHIAIIFPSH